MKEESRRPKLPLAYLVPGRRIATRYEIMEVLGRGGMGLVVKAKDLNLDCEPVALKILYPRFAANSTTLARFRREVLLTRRLAHPNIVRIFDLGVTQDTDTGETLHYLTMEFVAGESLEAKLKRSAPAGLPFDEIPRLVREIAAGLGYAHRAGIIHRDVKPANVLLGTDGAVKITDFGVARVVDSAENLTRTNEAIGSPNYMSPEQITAERIDHRADLYSLGILAYELAAGALPFKGEQWMQLVQQHLQEDLPTLSGPPAWFQEFLESACAKDRSKRFSTAEEMIAMLEMRAGESCGVRGRVNGVGGWIPKVLSGFAADHRLFAPTAAVLLVTLVGAGGYVVVNRLIEALVH
jgi:serine/threonine protein kinase